MEATYVYAIIPAPGQTGVGISSFPAEGGAGVDPGPVYCIAHNGLAAVVSASPLANYCGLGRQEIAGYLVVHQRIVEKVMQSSTLLPVRFGTILPGEDGVHRLLAQGSSLLRQALDRFAGLTQMEVVVLWNVQDVFREIGQHESIAQLRAQAEGRPPENTVELRVIIGQVVHTLLEERRAALCDRLLPVLREIALDVVVNPPMDDGMVVNLALLLNEQGRQALDQRLEELDREHDGQLLFRCVGPLPPYSFCTVEVQAFSFDVVDDARSKLGLDEVASLDDIKRAYYRLARQQHPDHSPGNPEAESVMAATIQAYQTMNAYVEGQLGRDAPQAVCRFDRQAVEEALLIAVRRQEIVF